jgi:F-type H+-transporting ATPase subunit b
MSLAAIPLAAENNPLIPDLGELIIGFIAFAVLVALLWKAAFPAIERVYHERTERIEGGIARADQAQQEAQRTLEQYRAQLAEARAEATRMREEARVQGQGIVEELRARAQQEAAQITARAEARIEADRQHAFAELRSEIGRLAVDLSGRIIGESLQDGDRQRRVVDRFLTDLEDAAGGAAGGASPAPPMR